MTEKDTDEQTTALALWNAPDPEDGSPEQGDIVPGDGARVPRGGSSLAVGLAACALGSVVAAYIPMLGCFAIGSGAVITLVPRNALQALATLACALVPAALVAAATDTQHDHGHGCDAELPSASKALCDEHCTAGDISADSGRIPSIPPLLVGAWLSWFAVAEIGDGARGVTSTWVDSPPRPAWHRPTAHPAALLLI